MKHKFKMLALRNFIVYNSPMAESVDIYSIMRLYANKQNSPSIYFSEFCEYMQKYARHYLESNPDLVVFLDNPQSAVMEAITELEGSKKVLSSVDNKNRRLITIPRYYSDKILQRYKEITSNPDIPFPQETEIDKKIDFFVRTSIPPVEGIFYDGQIFDAYKFVTELIKTARQSVIVIDNYVDETVLTMLDKRGGNVSATIYTSRINSQLELDLKRHNEQYRPIEVKVCKNFHDRFLITDRQRVYHIGASLKDLGKKLFAFSRLEINPDVIIGAL